MRLKTVTTSIIDDRSAVPPTTLTRSHTYDDYGRLSTTTYPAAVAANAVTVKREYNDRGYLEKLKHGETELVKVTAQTAHGQPKAVTHGNGVKTARTYDELGRLTDIDTTLGAAKLQDNAYDWRSDGSLESRIAGVAGSRSKRRESFDYDYLNRLTGAKTYISDSATASRTLAFGYDTSGNLTTKTSDVSADEDVTAYAYGSGTNRLSSATIDSVKHAVAHDTSGHVTRYDACSDNAAGCAGADDTFIDWNARGLAARVTLGAGAGDATPTARDGFRYGPDGARYFKKSEWDVAGTIKTSRKYYAGAYERTVEVGGKTVERTRIGDSVAHVTTTPRSGTASSAFEYAHRDHLGSLEAVTGASGNELVVLGHDPYGERRKPDWTARLTEAEIETLLGTHGERVSRGFTEHEHLDRTGLVHMNGRVYDPRLGRFLSPDPIVGDPTSSQSWNLYSYVGNNPLSHVDPTGLNPQDWGCGWLCQDDIDAWWDWFDFLNSWWDLPYDASSGPYGASNHANYESIRSKAKQTLRDMDQSVADEPADSEEIVVKIVTPWERPPDTHAKPKIRTREEVQRIFADTPYKRDRVDRKARREILDVLSHPVFADVAKEIFDDSQGRDPIRETGALRVYEKNGEYSVHSVGTPHPTRADRMKLNAVNEAMGRHVFDWHPHPGGSSKPSPADLGTSYRLGVPGVIKYGTGSRSRTIYQGGCKRGVTCE